ncbi:Forkhead box protein J2 [Smittium mucronatum]|uniref:Forkhead box protein J2 n=1 Tax=Smittium mucronatum TaxID=133383 RepID=A0A1R0H0Q8_9FUNG|nr:Forkhead box protein J2 [Smittium mucronatum]
MTIVGEYFPARIDLTETRKSLKIPEIIFDFAEDQISSEMSGMEDFNSNLKKRRSSVNESSISDDQYQKITKSRRRNSEIPINCKDILTHSHNFGDSHNVSLIDQNGFQNNLEENQHQNKPQGRRKSLKTEARSRAGSIDVTLLLDDSATLKPFSDGRLPHSYATIITYAILHHPSKKMTLNEIYNWILNRYPHFKDAGCGWKNSIRHNLSLNRIFVKMIRPEKKAGKGSYWTVDFHVLRESIANGAKKRRIPPEILFSNGLWPRFSYQNKNMPINGFLGTSKCKDASSTANPEFTPSNNIVNTNYTISSNENSLARQLSIIEKSEVLSGQLRADNPAGYHKDRVQQDDITSNLISQNLNNQQYKYLERNSNLANSEISKFHGGEEFFIPFQEEISGMNRFGESKNVSGSFFNPNIMEGVCLNNFDEMARNSSLLSDQIDQNLFNGFDFPINFQTKENYIVDQFSNNPIDHLSKNNIYGLHNEVPFGFGLNKFSFCDNIEANNGDPTPYLVDFQQQKSVPFPEIQEPEQTQNTVINEGLIFNCNMLDFINCLEPNFEYPDLSLFNEDFSGDQQNSNAQTLNQQDFNQNINLNMMGDSTISFQDGVNNSVENVFSSRNASHKRSATSVRTDKSGSENTPSEAKMSTDSSSAPHKSSEQTKSPSESITEMDQVFMSGFFEDQGSENLQSGVNKISKKAPILFETGLLNF